MKNKETQPVSQTPGHESELIPLFTEIKQLLLQKREELSICPEWIPKAIAQKYLDYGDTQFSTLILNGELVTTKVGRRVFVNRQSIIALLERNIQ